MFKNWQQVIFIFLIIINLFFYQVVIADSPSGDDTFELITDHITGGDATGDGGTGDTTDYNYYYVGQSFITTIRIKSGGTTAANIWLDYDSVLATASNLTTGSYFNSWSGQSIDPDERGAGLGRVKSTGSNIPLAQSSGTGNFGTVKWTLNKPTEAGYATNNPGKIDINEGIIGQTTESNISLSGNDILDDVEDFMFHVWADTIKPYALNPSPADGANNVAVESNYTFDLCDSKSGEVADAGVCLSSGVGTGVVVPGGANYITFDTGSGEVDYTAYDSYSCTNPNNVWTCNWADVTVNPSSPSGIAGDTRNWEYNTTYTVRIRDFLDRASPNQDQLGDTNGPNIMDTKTWTFTTEGDTVAPQVTSETPARNSNGVAVNTALSVTVQDKKTYPGSISGTGIVSSTCRIDVWSDSFTKVTYRLNNASTTVTAVDYGYRFDLEHDDFPQNEVINVKVYGCEDRAAASNIMADDNYVFTTADTEPPYVDDENPGNDMGIDPDGKVMFSIKDTGVGVDIANTVIYVNGTYFTNDGGAVNVTTNGTIITNPTSENFNLAPNSVSGNVNNYTFSLDPPGNFFNGESVPVIIYTKDLSGNIMIRHVYGLIVGGGAGQICGNGILEGNEVCDDGNNVDGDGCSANCLSDESCGNGLVELNEECDDGNNNNGDGCDSTCNYETTPGSTYCGVNTNWNGAMCVGTGGGVASTGSSSNSESVYIIEDGTFSITQSGDNSVLITWRTNQAAEESWVVYGLQSPSDYGQAPQFGYQSMTKKAKDNSSLHTIYVNGLQPGLVYYFRVISKINGHIIRGNEHLFALNFCLDKQIVDNNEPDFASDSSENDNAFVLPKQEDKGEEVQDKEIVKIIERQIIRYYQIEENDFSITNFNKNFLVIKLNKNKEKTDKIQPEIIGYEEKEDGRISIFGKGQKDQDLYLYIY